MNALLARSMTRSAPGMYFTLRQAEQRVHASKSTILRAIRSGKLSAERDGSEGSYKIEPSELFRVFPPISAEPATPIVTNSAEATSLDPVAMARLAADNEKLSALLDAERRRAEELREDRDSWRAQAERLTLVHHVATANDAGPPKAQEGAARPNLLERLGRALRG